MLGGLGSPWAAWLCLRRIAPAPGRAARVQWADERRAEAVVIHLTGYLGPRSADRFVGALGWDEARHATALIVDVTGLLDRSAQGQAAQGCVLRLCGAGDLPPLAVAGPPLPVYADLDTALGRAEPTRSRRVWTRALGGRAHRSFPA